MASCKYHPGRPGVGVCMRCRAVVCEACTTRLDGVNHCHACLRELAAPAEGPSGGRLRRLAAGAAVFVPGWVSLFVLYYLLQGRLAP